jgi:hypothetical protein
LANIVNQLQGQQDYTWKKTAGSTALQMVPKSGFLRWVKNLVDPTIRKGTSIEDTIKAAIPGLSEQVAAVKTSRGLDAQADLWDAISPYKIGTVDARKEFEYQKRMDILHQKATIAPLQRQLKQTLLQKMASKKPIGSVIQSYYTGTGRHREELLPVLQSKWEEFKLTHNKREVEMLQKRLDKIVGAGAI